MHVDRAVGRDIEHGLRQDLAVGDDDDHVRCQFAQFSDDAFVTHGIRLEDGEAQFQGLFLDRRIGHFLAAAALLVGLRINSRDVVTGLGQFFQGRDREIRRPHEDDA